MVSSIRRSISLLFCTSQSATLFGAFVGLLVAAAPCSAEISATPANANPNPGATTTFTITVPAGDTLKSVSVLTMGAPNLDYTAVAAGTTCPTLTAGSCTVAVKFQPTKSGRRQGAVLVTDAAGDSLSVSLNGVATGPVA